MHTIKKKLKLVNFSLTSLSYDLYSALDNQKASKNTFQAAAFKVEENSRTSTESEGLFKEKWNSRNFQGLTLKFKDFSRLLAPCLYNDVISLTMEKPFIQDSGKQGSALAVPSGPGQLENLSYFTETSC